jgi:hypothetical protein
VTGRRAWITALAVSVAAPALPAGGTWASPASVEESVRAESTAGTNGAPTADAGNATTLYNAGTLALERGEIGPAVAFLTASKRLEPRAADIRANLEQAETASLLARGGDASDTSSFDLPVLLSAAESWWVAAILLALAAIFALAGIARRVPARLRIAFPTLLGLGLLISAWLHIQAWEEAAHPEAVVVRPALSIERGPGEPSRAAALLGAGERVRLGAVRGRQVEIRIGGNSIGWADREGLWKVVETPRYTPQYAKR